VRSIHSDATSRRPDGTPAHPPSVARRALGYASGLGRGPAAARELAEQAEVIAQECEERGLELVEVVHEREPANGKALSRPGLTYALERITNAEAGVLVVSELSRITRSAAELGTVIQWISGAGGRLVATAHALDTDRIDGRLAADLLVEVSSWEAARLSERTRHGLEAARRNGRSTGRPAVADHPDLKERIIQMRADGMTLQAIADRLNEEGVPTVRGGSKWRHSSVQAAAGYKRRRPRIPVGPPGSTAGS
jgi:DNA invertase Pin-like site-specific DNA recombinase